jgi:hypothetical protein
MCSRHRAGPLARAGAHDYAAGGPQLRRSALRALAVGRPKCAIQGLRTRFVSLGTAGRHGGGEWAVDFDVTDDANHTECGDGGSDREFVGHSTGGSDGSVGTTLCGACTVAVVVDG